MDELTLGLIGVGAVVVGGIVVYNAWQGAKVRRRMSRPMPSEVADMLSRQERNEDAPFIEPVRYKPMASAPVATAGHEARVEPTFSGAPDTPAPLAPGPHRCGLGGPICRPMKRSPPAPAR